MLASAQVKAALATRITGLASTGARVYTSRTWPLTEDLLPAWKVITQGEEIEVLTIHEPVLQQHSLRVDLQGVAQAFDTLDDSLDELTVELLYAIFNPPAMPDALSGLTSVELNLTNIDRNLGRDGQAEIGQVTVTLLAQFRTLRHQPDTIVP